MKTHKNQIFEAVLKEDWCHLCGHRAEMMFVTMHIPENAEHSLKGGRYFRVCQDCVSDMKDAQQQAVMKKMVSTK